MRLLARVLHRRHYLTGAVVPESVNKLPLFVLAMVHHNVDAFARGRARHTRDSSATTGDCGNTRRRLPRCCEKLLNHVRRLIGLSAWSRLSHTGRIDLGRLLPTGQERIIRLGGLRVALVREWVVRLSAGRGLAGGIRGLTRNLGLHRILRLTGINRLTGLSRILRLPRICRLTRVYRLSGVLWLPWVCRLRRRV